MQLFAESLVLGGVAAAVGLAFASLALRWWLGVSEAESGGQLPFWLDARLSPVTVFYAFALTLLGAAITGVIPALKVTGRRIEGQLRRVSGGTQLQMGDVWTVVIVAQVAVTVAFPAAAFFARQGVVLVQSMDVGFPADQYLSARLEMDGEPRARLETVVREFGQRLSAEAAVAGVTFTDRLPRTNHPERRIELDAETLQQALPDALPPVSRAAVAVNFSRSALMRGASSRRSSRARWCRSASAFLPADCLLACVVPTRRALHVQPIEALRSE